MTSEELKKISAAKIVDARAVACPGPLLAAKKSMGDMDSGQVMEVYSSDEGTKVDIPKWCGKMGHEYLGVVESDSYFSVFLKKA
ncbi:MAG: sulfurtransferase TusA family protein [Spirochaetota bacterium]